MTTRLQQRAGSDCRVVQAVCFCACFASIQPVWCADPAASQPDAPQTITISAKLKPVLTAIDRKVYNVSGDVQALTGSAADVLNTIPSVEVDADGNVSLRGDDRVTILVDGKPSAQLSGARAGDGLTQFSAADIEKIEVMTNAPAEYGADGTGGVINIVTRKNRKQGASGSLALNAGNQGRSVDTLNGAYNDEKLSVAGGIGLREDERERIIGSNVAAQGPGGTPTELSHNWEDEHARRLIPSLNGALDYRFDQAQSLGFDFKLRQRSGHRAYDAQNASTLPDGTLDSAAFGHSDGHEWSMSGEQRLRYKQNLSSADETLEVSLHRSTDIERERYDYASTSTYPSIAPGGNLLFLNHAYMTNDVSADYRAALGNDRIVKLGYSARHDSYGYDNSGSTVDPASGQLLQDPTLVNQFLYLQTIQALYGSYQQALGQWQALAGLRFEHTDGEGNEYTSATVNRQHYSGLYPSLNLERPLDEHATLSFGYSRRLARPNPDDLDPYIDRHDSQNLQSGNPNLLPQQSQSLEAGYRVEAEKQTWGVSAYLRRFTNSFTDLTTLVSPGVLLTTKANLPSSKAGGFEFNTDGPLARTLSYRLAGNLFYSQVDATALGAPGLESTTGLNLKASLDYRPSASDTAQLSATRADKRLTAQGYITAINLLNLGYKRQLSPDLTLVATVSDVFNGQRQVRTVNTTTLTETYERDQAGRIAYIGLVYTFGAQKKSKSAAFEYDQP